MTLMKGMKKVRGKESITTVITFKKTFKNYRPRTDFLSALRIIIYMIWNCNFLDQAYLIIPLIFTFSASLPDTFYHLITLSITFPPLVLKHYWKSSSECWKAKLICSSSSFSFFFSFFSFFNQQRLSSIYI